MRYAAILSVVAIILVGCPTPGKSPNPIPVPDTHMCGDMCNYLIQLGCEEGKPLYDSDVPGPVGVPNESCEDWCVKQQGNGIFLNPRCVMKATSCLAVETMRQKTSCE